MIAFIMGVVLGAYLGVALIFGKISYNVYKIDPKKYSMSNVIFIALAWTSSWKNLK